MAKAYIFLADGFEEVEALTVVDLLRRAGIEIPMISISKSLEVTGAHQIRLWQMAYSMIQVLMMLTY